MIHPVQWIAEHFASAYARWGAPDSLRAAALRQTGLRRCRMEPTALCVDCRPARCCRELEVELTPAEYATGWYRVDATRLRGSGRAFLARDAGGCVYLVDERCSIYDHRPAPCRDYDCARDSRMHITWPA